VVQGAVPTTLAGPAKSLADMLGDYLTASEAFAPGTCDLMVWPETVVPHSLNDDLLTADLETMSPEALRALGWWYWRDQVTGETVPIASLRAALVRVQAAMKLLADRIGQTSVRLGCPILTGGATLHRLSASDDPWFMRNSAMWFDRSGRLQRLYGKRHLVPFSEAVPFRDAWPALHRLLRRVVPPVMVQIDPGDAWTRFALSRDGRTWSVASPICYEGTFARICRRMVIADGRKAADILINLSNDGWFVYAAGARGHCLSAEHAQHLVSYCFRAVENRVPVVRAVNTGISASIDSTGRIVAFLGGRDGMAAGTPMRSGRLLLTDTGAGSVGITRGPQVLVDGRVTVYSLHGDVFAAGVGLLAAAMVVYVALRRRVGR